MTSPPRTPIQGKVLRQLENLDSSLHIPQTPLMKNIAFGTGVEVLRYKRSPLMNTVRSPWAIKRITKRHVDDPENSIKNRLNEEASILRSLNHPNIVGFRGMTNVNGNLNLVMEDCNESLGALLEDRFEAEMGPLEVKFIKKMCADTIEGLHYLHTKAHYLHGDMKSFNILVKGNFDICKICDFGVSLPLDEDGFIDTIKNPMAKFTGTQLWCAPEALINNNEKYISYKADMFSFGLIIYECIALIPPHTWIYNTTAEEEQQDNSIENEENISSEIVAVPVKSNDESCGDDDDEGEELDEIELLCGTRPPLPESQTLDNEYNVIVELFITCTNADPEDRPAASSLRTLFLN